MDELRLVMSAEIAMWVRGETAAFLLNNASTSAGKGLVPLRLLAKLAETKRHKRTLFIQEWRRAHPLASAHEAAEAASKAGLRPLRVGMFADNHTIAAQHAETARGLGMIAAHDAGMDRPYDPGDASSPPRCTQKERAKQTRFAGEPLRPVACGIDLNGPHCPDHESCRDLQSHRECTHAEFVSMVAERATSWSMPKHLRGFDFVVIDQPPERVFRPERDRCSTYWQTICSSVTRCATRARQTQRQQWRRGQDTRRCWPC